ncbi:hypothetical protein MKY84_02870 [Chryseomicrobium sp. FSL W7-1435]|uniref:hypothetical protein n=1 Tax=Chryseomicrobium sp. FSL W7-1435 TaxID=2921704 RepID=UPI00315AAB57
MEKWESDLKKFKNEHENDIEDVWQSIQKTLDQEKRTTRRKQFMKRTWIAGVAAVAILVAAVFFLSMDTQAPERATEIPSESINNAGNDELSEDDPGYFAQEIQKLENTYPEQQQIPLEIEGMTEQIPMVRVVPGNLAYLFYVDEERYEISFDEPAPNQISVLVNARDQLGAAYPEVGLKIDTVPGKTPTELASEQAAILEARYPGMTIEAEPVTEPIVGYKLHARAGDEANSEVTTVYVLDEQHDDSTIVITQTVFLEAQEGHGARFYAMLKTLEVLN